MEWTAGQLVWRRAGLRAGSPARTLSTHRLRSDAAQKMTRPLTCPTSEFLQLPDTGAISTQHSSHRPAWDGRMDGGSAPFLCCVLGLTPRACLYRGRGPRRPAAKAAAALPARSDSRQGRKSTPMQPRAGRPSLSGESTSCPSPPPRQVATSTKTALSRDVAAGEAVPNPCCWPSGR